MSEEKKCNCQIEHYCHWCDEALIKKEGSIKNTIEGVEVHLPVYVCEECDVAFALFPSTNELANLPFDSNMKKTEFFCKDCNKKEIHRMKMMNVLDNDMFLELVCPECGVKRAIKEMPEFFTKDAKTSWKDVEGLFHFLKSQKIFSDPKEMERIKNLQKMKKVMQELGLEK